MTLSYNTILKDTESGYIDYEEEVKKQFPEAKLIYENSCYMHEEFFYIDINEKIVPETICSTKQRAWKSAYETLKKEGKI
jgi:hypothetical protein